MDIPVVVYQVFFGDSETPGEITLVPGKQSMSWCEVCRQETAYEVDMYAMSNESVSEAALLTVSGCALCDDDQE